MAVGTCPGAAPLPLYVHLDPNRAASRRLGIPASPMTVRALAVAEVALGALVLTVAGAAELVAAGVLYVAFLASLAASRLRTG